MKVYKDQYQQVLVNVTKTVMIICSIAERTMASYGYPFSIKEPLTNFHKIKKYEATLYWIFAFYNRIF